MKRYIHFKEIDSTNTYLKNHHTNYDDLTFVSSSYQTTGHGRVNRNWESNRNENIMFSILLKSRFLIENYSSISLLMSTCVYKLLIEAKIKDVSIKWPNDVYVDDKKICGILLEGIANECLIVGIGLNVNQIHFNDLKAISMRNITNKKYCLSILKRKLYRIIIKELDLFEKGQSNYLEIVRSNNYLKNKTVNAEINNQIKEVKVLEINNDNSLKVLVDGKEKDIISGEITFHS